MREQGRDRHRVGSRTAFRCNWRVAAAIIALLAFDAGRAAAWNGSAPGLQDLNGEVTALVVHQGALVAGGMFTAAGEAPDYLARWTGTCWQGFEPALDGPVHALAVLQGDLIVGGQFEHAGSTPAANVARWDGSTWNPLGAGINGPVHDLLVQAGVILYAAGDFTAAGGEPARSVARYVGSTWTKVGGGLEGTVKDLELFNGSLVAGGDFRVAGPDPWERNLARLIGNQWVSLARGIDGKVSALAIYQGGLVAGGDFLHVDFVTPAHHVAWFLGEWYPIGFGFGVNDTIDVSEVRNLTLQGDDLLAGGAFELADLSTATGVARWNGSGWTPLGDGVGAPVNALLVDGEVLYAGGEFHTAGGWSCDHVAAFRDGAWCPMSVVPVAIEALSATRTPAGVRLSWQVSAGARQDLVGIGVERGIESRGPFTACMGNDLEPAAAMEYLDTDTPAGGCWYRLALVGRAGERSYAGPVPAPASLPLRTTLAVPHELPGSAGVRLGFALATPGRACLLVYDVRGRLLRTLETGALPVGNHVRIWDRRDESGAHVRRGVYVVRLGASGVTVARKLVLKQP